MAFHALAFRQAVKGASTIRLNHPLAHHGELIAQVLLENGLKSGAGHRLVNKLLEYRESDSAMYSAVQNFRVSSKKDTSPAWGDGRRRRK
jgi:hypothetical protein